MAFTFKNGEMYIEKLKTSDLADKFDTPVYCYSLNTLRKNFNDYKDSLPNSIICFAVKSNSNLTILRTIAKLGGGADVVSEGEIRLALEAGIPPEKIVFSGVGKMRREIKFALEKNIHQINFESIDELKLINKIAHDMNKCVPVSARLTPNIDAKTNYKISTGLCKNKFGIPLDILETVDFKQLPNVELVGISAHIGSQILSLDIFCNEISYLKESALKLKNNGHKIMRLDVGGGLGVSYNHKNEAPSILDYANQLRENLGQHFEIICEPGRSIMANTGVLLTKVLYKKFNGCVSHVIIDAGMNDFVRPAIYGSSHIILPTKIDDSLPKRVVDIVGPVCETSDTFANNYLMQEVNDDDLLCICDVGAYGASMSNSYNSRLIAPEILINGEKTAVIRNRGTYELLLKQTNICEDILR